MFASEPTQTLMTISQEAAQAAAAAVLFVAEKSGELCMCRNHIAHLLGWAKCAMLELARREQQSCMASQMLC